MKLRRILAGTATTMLIGAGSVVATVPAQASTPPQFVIKVDINSFTGMKVNPGNWDMWQGRSRSFDMAGTRVDTDPYGPSHSYTIDGGPCHTNSDNHESDPTNNGGTHVYRNFDHGDCTN